MAPNYKNAYADIVSLHQLSKPVVGYSRSIGPSIFGSQRFKLNASIGGGTSYSVKLLEAFPTAINAVELNNELDGIIQLTIELSYTNWTRDWRPQNFLNFSINTPFGELNII